MPRIDKTMLKGLREATAIHAERVIVVEEVEVEALSDTEIFTSYVTKVYNALTYRWSMDHIGGTPTVSLEVFIRYCLTAVNSRLGRVNNERTNVRCDARWCLPPQIAVPINGMGRVNLERPVALIKPMWPHALDGEIMSYEEWHATSQLLRGMTEYPGSKFVMADALSGDRTGDDVLMSLIPVRDENGRIITLRSSYDIDAIAAVSYLICGLNPRSLDGTTLPDHPLLMSPSFIRVAGLLQYMDQLAEIGA